MCVGSEGQRSVPGRCLMSVGFHGHQHYHCSGLLRVCARRHIGVSLISVKELSELKKGPGQRCKRRQLLWWAKRLPAPHRGALEMAGREARC